MRDPQARCGTCRQIVEEYLVRDDEIICRHCDRQIELAVVPVLAVALQQSAIRIAGMPVRPLTTWRGGNQA